MATDLAKAERLTKGTELNVDDGGGASEDVVPVVDEKPMELEATVVSSLTRERAIKFLAA